MFFEGYLTLINLIRIKFTTEAHRVRRPNCFFHFAHAELLQLTLLLLCLIAGAVEDFMTQLFVVSRTRCLPCPVYQSFVKVISDRISMQIYRSQTDWARAFVKAVSLSDSAERCQIETEIEILSNLHHPLRVSIPLRPRECGFNFGLQTRSAWNRLPPFVLRS
jgi:hypothetical protein